MLSPLRMNWEPPVGVRTTLLLASQDHMSIRAPGSVTRLKLEHDVPRRAQALGVPHGDFILDGVWARHADALDRAGLVAVVGLAALILAVGHANGVHDERLPIPEPDGVAGPQRLCRFFGDVSAAVGIDAARLTLLLVDPPGLAWRDDELFEEWLGQPARVSRRQAVAQLIPFVSGGDFAKLRIERGLVARREIRRDRPEGNIETVAFLFRVELQSLAEIA